ncbi:MAG: hypothetical protein MUP55_02485, partial [Candidatus Aenigmarchaeota archaeon]|nr:hypothetical protein [Candidatus Aenigmarchaeota archaeon]
QLEKDKMFNQVEAGFEKVKEIFQEIQPKKIRAELDKKEDAIEKISAKVESFDTKISGMRKDMADILGIMEKIKDLKNVVAVSETISKKMAKIEDERKETTKIAAKVESMFSEITEKMSEFHAYKNKIDFSSESMHDIMKSIDMMEVKIENALTKDNMKKIDDRFEQLEKDLSDKIQTIRDIVDDLVTDLKKGGVKDLLEKQGKARIDEINKRLSEMSTYDKAVNSLKEDFAKLKDEKAREIKLLISEIESVKQGKVRISGKKAEQLERRRPQTPSIENSLAAEFRKQAQAAPEPDFPETDSSGQDINYLMEQCHSQIDRGNI